MTEMQSAPDESTGIAAALGFFVNLGTKLDKTSDKLLARSAKPVHKPVGGSAVADGVNPTIIRVNSKPQAGRIWNILSAGIYGNDPHTPVGAPATTATGGFAQGASVAAPGANTQIVAITLPPGTYQVSVTALASGTLAAADNNNINLRNSSLGTNITGILLMDATTANAPTINPPVQITLTTTQTIQVRSIAAATAGSIYSAVITAIPVADFNSDLSPVFADLYAGQVPDPMTAALTDVIDSGMTVPSSNDYSAGVYWASMLDELFAVVYNAAANQQLVLVVNVAEYPVEAVEAMSLE